jgi:SAM-dependent methyltransferase
MTADAQTIWDARYARVLREGRTVRGEPWVDRWLHLLRGETPRRALDLGCGCGHVARLLLRRGFEVTAVDFAASALTLCARRAPGARLVQADVRDGLPFLGERFDLVVADLSLHYFPWDETVAVHEDVASRLAPGGLFATRLNATGDTHHGAGSGEPVPGEPNLRLVGGLTKRFFSRECIDRLFAPPWSVIAVEEIATDRFRSTKVLWEVVARRDRCSERETSLF